MNFFSSESNNTLANAHKKTEINKIDFQTNFNFSFDENLHENKYATKNYNEGENIFLDFEEVEANNFNNLKKKNFNIDEKKSSSLTLEKISSKKDFISNNNLMNINKKEDINFEEFDETNDDFFKIDHENFFNYNFTNSYNTKKKNEEDNSKISNDNKMYNITNEENNLSSLNDLCMVSEYMFGKNYENNLNNNYSNKNHLNNYKCSIGYSDNQKKIKDDIISNNTLMKNDNYQLVHTKNSLISLEKDMFEEFKSTNNLRKNEEKKNEISFEDKELHEVSNIKEERIKGIQNESSIFINENIQKNKDRELFGETFFKNKIIEKMKNEIKKGKDEKLFESDLHEEKQIDKKGNHIENGVNKIIFGEYLYENEKTENEIVENKIKQYKLFSENKNMEKLEQKVERNNDKKLFENDLCKNKEIENVEQKLENNSDNKLCEQNIFKNEQIYEVESSVEESEEGNHECEYIEKENKKLFEKTIFQDKKIYEVKSIVGKFEDGNYKNENKEKDSNKKLFEKNFIENKKISEIEKITKKGEDKKVYENDLFKNIDIKKDDNILFEKIFENEKKYDDESLIVKCKDGYYEDDSTEKDLDQKLFEKTKFENKQTCEIESTTEKSENVYNENEDIKKDVKKYHQRNLFENEKTFEIESIEEKSEEVYDENKDIEKDHKKLFENIFIENEKINKIDSITKKEENENFFENCLIEHKEVKKLKFDKSHKIRNIDEIDNIIGKSEDIKLFKNILYENKETEEFKVNKLFKNENLEKKSIHLHNIKNMNTFINDNKLDSLLSCIHKNPKKNKTVHNINLRNMIIKEKNLSGEYTEMNYTDFLNYNEGNMQKNYETSKNIIKNHLNTISKKQNEIYFNEKRKMLNRKNTYIDYKDNFRHKKIPNLRKNKNMLIDDMKDHKNFIEEYNGIIEKEKVLNIANCGNNFMLDKKEANFNFDTTKSKTNILDEIKKKKKIINRIPFSFAKKFEYGSNSLTYIRGLKYLPHLEFRKCKELRPYLHLFNIVLKIICVNYMNENFMYILMGDETGCIYLKLSIKYKEFCLKEETLMLVNSCVVVEDGHIILEINEYSNIFIIKYNIIKNVNENINFSEMKFVTLS
ncbi:conserved Plasmodium protein, unknown function [Plasmodium gallinaceum]|uniref:Uncharacterized protein n=1 Tax=Plasmodium gallinaceum TaxID=5849 RepID=A0A1J1GSK4_PLAGA|nr:conserved Plasmodium protein, unknown function [Plasmodium gallinaceum]CRG95447.1 conserved Plasmodium protein, unknown function [Plasmodium gallinaceum]